MIRACALRGGEWLIGKGLTRRGVAVHDLALADLEGLATEIMGEFVRQLASEGKNAETEPVPELHFTG